MKVTYPQEKPGPRGKPMAQEPEAQRTAKLERRIRRTVEANAPDAVATSYVEMLRTGGGHIIVLVVANSFARSAQRLHRSGGEVGLELLVVDREMFEADVRDSSLLEAAAGRLLLPYVALEGEDYLTHWEGVYKRRKIMETLADLAMEHPELSSELLIDPRYFVHENLLRLSHLLPQAYELLRDLDEEGCNLLSGYIEALGDLEREETIHIKEGLVTVDRHFVDEMLERGLSVSDQLTRAHRQLQGLLRLGLRGAVDLFRPQSGLSVVEGLLSNAIGATDLPRSDRFLHFPTATSLVPLSDSIGIEELLDKLEPSDLVGKAQLQRFGGVLNEVYLMTYAADGSTRKAIVKRYPNWVSLKWAPIALWTLGTKNFAINGRSRMERECATTSLLSRCGVPVPRILHTSFENRLLVREYIEGKCLAAIVKSAIQGGGASSRQRELLKRVGRTMATVHNEGATLGDCKPENFIIAAVGDPVIVDLEQGAWGGDETWDVAEFLYFSGHYAAPFTPLKGVVEVARCFIEGYLAGGGCERHVTEAARLRYTKVFTPLTLPNVINAIAKTCRARESSVCSPGLVSRARDEPQALDEDLL